MPEDGKGVSRRGFMQVASLSTAMAAVGAACAKPHAEDRSVRAPARRGRRRATRCTSRPRYALDGYASGLLVESHEGAPDEDRGQPRAPADAGRDDRRSSRASSSAFTTTTAPSSSAAARGRSPGGRSWPRWRCAPAAWPRPRGAGLRFLTAPTTSPLLDDLRRRILERFPRAKFVSYSSVADDGAVDGAKLAFGKPLVPRHQVGAGQRDPVAGRRLPGRGHRADAAVARVRRAPRAEPPDEPPLRRRAGA